MNPNDPNLAQPNPAPEPVAQPSVPPQEPPVFRNPLAQGYEGSTTQLPSMSQNQGQAAAVAPQPSPNLPQATVPNQSIPPAPEQLQPAQEPTVQPSQPAQPTVSELSNSPIKPAPVRLAPVPRSDDMHAGGLQAASQTMPFGGTPEGVAAAPQVNQAAPSVSMPSNSESKRKPIGLIVGLAVGLVVVFLAAIGGYAFFVSQRSTQPTATTPVAVGSVRDTTEKPIQPFSEKISTDCYVAQSLTPVETQSNKDCALSITYGEQKISSIFVSAFNQFDIATDQNANQSGQNATTGVDTKQYLEALIANIIPKDLVTTREDIKVGGLDAVKVVGKKDASSGVDVAYVFIILPEGDRTFGEKNFIAFIVTGAYNDDYSRKGFNQFLSTWSWK